jgi:hypothetical protein
MAQESRDHFSRWRSADIASLGESPVGRLPLPSYSFAAGAGHADKAKVLKLAIAPGNLAIC